jgi:hypothetical protein
VIIHKTKTIIFLMIIMALVINGIGFLSPYQHLVIRIFILPACIWLVFYMLTNSLRIDEKGISELYSIFQNELWAVKQIDWENIESVSFDKGLKSFVKNVITVFPKNRNATLLSTNVISINTTQYDCEKIVVLLLEHGVAIPPELMPKSKIQ